MEKHRKELGKNVRVGIIYSGFSCFYFMFFSICFCCTKLVIIHLVSCPFKYMHFTMLAVLLNTSISLDLELLRKVCKPIWHLF